MIEAPTILSIAGSDSSGGAGIQADIQTITALGGRAMTAITAVTAQNSYQVAGIVPVDATFLKLQMDTVCQEVTPSAVKIGMISHTEQIDILKEEIGRYHWNSIVMDPVLCATTGTALFQATEIEKMTQLFPHVSLITPNIPEAERFLATGKRLQTRAEMQQAAEQLGKRYRTAVLLKGGHFPGNTCDDVLWYQGNVTWFSGKRIPAPQSKTHGTGCTLSSAIATLLARGFSLEESVQHAKSYLMEKIQN